MIGYPRGVLVNRAKPAMGGLAVVIAHRSHLPWDVPTLHLLVVGYGA